MNTNIDITTNLALIRNNHPVVHNITNYVVMELTANCLLALGASPIMAHAVEELEEIANIAASLVVNIGTLDNHWIGAMQKAIQTANKIDIPVILDPVGAGATSLRTQTSIDFLNKNSISVIRGNAAEIMALANITIKSQGVDSNYQSDAADEASSFLAEKYNCTVVISGATDIIRTQKKVAKIKNGNPIMSQVTGMGCTSSAVIGAFCATDKNYFNAATAAMTTMGIAGELAAANSKGPGSFKTEFLDQLSSLNKATIAERANIAIQS